MELWCVFVLELFYLSLVCVFVSQKKKIKYYLINNKNAHLNILA